MTMKTVGVYDKYGILDWYEKKGASDTIIGTTQKTICDKCGKTFEYISRGSKRHRCDSCKKTSNRRGYGNKKMMECW
jgi:protein-arginine kinase activator protein McsA